MNLQRQRLATLHALLAVAVVCLAVSPAAPAFAMAETEVAPPLQVVANPPEHAEAATTGDALRVQDGGTAAVVASGTWGTCPWEITADGVLTIHEGVGGKATDYDDDEGGYDFSSGPWWLWSNTVTAVRTSCAEGKKVVAPDCGHLFHDMSSIRTVDLSNWDVSSAEIMYGMFAGCSSLASLDLSGWDTSSVERMDSMFKGCSSLASLDLSGWDTSSAWAMDDMFYDCSSLASLDLSGWDTSSVTYMHWMFSGCSSLASLDLSGWDTSSVIYMNQMFARCSSLASLDLSGWDVSSVRGMYYMFSRCSSLASLDLSGWDVSSVEGIYGMFSDCSSLASLDLSGWDVSSAGSIDSMFSDCSSLVSLDLSGWDVSSVEGMGDMFSGCSSLASLDLSGWDVSSVERMENMFDGCTSLASLTVSEQYVFKSADMMPEATSGSGKWWSVADRAWYTRDEIVAGRSGIADTYLNQAEPIDISLASVSPLEGLSYTGEALTPRPTVNCNGKELRLDVDYKLSYVDNVNAGTATVTLTGIGDFSGEKAVTFLIAKAAQSVDAADVTIAMGGTSAIVARASGGGELSYGCSDESVATVDADGTVTPRSVGRATVTVTAAETANHEAASATVTVIVTRGAQELSLASARFERTFGDAPFSLGASLASDDGDVTYETGDPAVATVDESGMVTVVGAGTTTVTARAAATDAYEAASVTAEIVVAKAASSIKLASQTKTYTGKAIAYSGKVTKKGSAGMVSYRYFSDKACKKAVKMANVKAAGTYYVKATVAADANHEAATSAAARLTVKKATNPMAVKAVARTAKLATLKKKAVTVAAPLKFAKKAQGKIAYAKASGPAALTINKSTGKVTVRKGTKKGTYTIKVKVTAAGNSNYGKLTKTVTCKVVVK